MMRCAVIWWRQHPRLQIPYHNVSRAITSSSHLPKESKVTDRRLNDCFVCSRVYQFLCIPQFHAPARGGQEQNAYMSFCHQPFTYPPPRVPLHNEIHMITFKSTLRRLDVCKKLRNLERLTNIRNFSTVRYPKNINKRTTGTSNFRLHTGTSLIEYLKRVYNIHIQSMSTSFQEFSLENTQVQKYLKSLKEKYDDACGHNNEANSKIIRTLKPIVDLMEEVEATRSEVEELKLLAVDGDGDKEMRDLAQEDLKQSEDTLFQLQEQLFDALVPEDSVDNTNVVLEVSAGIGGQEAMLFCADIFNMYQGFADYMGWQSDITDYVASDIGGLRKATMILDGDMVYRIMKYEGGTHRVQRIPKTEKAGRIHTSTVSVAVMPQPTEIDIQIADKDLKIETKRASGAGGQHVNTTDSAVRITHLPSGLSVESQVHRSQHQNRNNCIIKIRALLYQRELEENTATYSSHRKLQVGTKARSEKIRTYNYTQDRITDHRIGLSVHNLPTFLSGSENLYSLISQLLEEAKRETLQELFSSPPK